MPPVGGLTKHLLHDIMRIRRTAAAGTAVFPRQKLLEKNRSCLMGGYFFSTKDNRLNPCHSAGVLFVCVGRSLPYEGEAFVGNPPRKVSPFRLVETRVAHFDKKRAWNANCVQTQSGGGDGGIRTHVPISGQNDFESFSLRPLRYISKSKRRTI